MTDEPMSRHTTRLIALVLAVLFEAAAAVAQDQSLTVRAARVLDGKGGSLANATLEVRGGRIVAVSARMAGPRTMARRPATWRSPPPRTRGRR
jgi:hypothetical protein